MKVKLRYLRKEKYLKGTTATADPYDADFDEDPEVAAVEWTWGKGPVSCPWIKVTESVYDFDIKKADKIFDLLLEKKQLRLPLNHVIPSARELKGKSIASFTTVPPITLMSVEFFACISKRPLSRGRSDSSQLRSQ